MEAEFVSIAPSVEYLYALRAERIEWWKGIGELIDNALDADATRILLRNRDGVFEIEDDGRGIAEVDRALVCGKHIHVSTTKLGMFGIGLKNAWLSFGDRIEIDTVYNGERQYLNLHFEQVIASNWEIRKPARERTDRQNGTKIRIHLRQEKSGPTSKTYQCLANIFTPAIDAGKKIGFYSGGAKSLITWMEPCKLPPFGDGDRVTESFSVCGLPVSIDIGIIADGHRNAPMDPFWIQFGHRVIAESGIGAEGFCISRMAGRVVLGDGWPLSKNKDGLLDTDEVDQLKDEIFRRIEHLLRKAASLAESIECGAFNAEIEDALNDIIDTRREARQQSDGGTGAVAPGSSGRRRRNATRSTDSPGSVIGRKPRGAFSIAWTEKDDESNPGTYDYMTNTVTFNRNNPYLRACYESRNALATLGVALSLIADHHCRHYGEQSRLSFDKMEFRPLLGHLFAAPMKLTEAVNA